MQCLDCGYISFKKEKACRSCGFMFNKSTQSLQSLAGKETFSIFGGSEKGQSEDSSVVENVGLLDEQEPATFIDPETGDFNLDLPDTSEETTKESPVSSESTEYQSIEFNTYENIELEEIEGLGLEPLHAVEILREPETDTTIDSIEEIKIDEPEEIASLEPVLEIDEPEKIASLEPVLEIGKPKSEKEASDLDDNKIVLGLDDNQSNSVAPPVAAAPLDDIELNLEIDEPEETASLEPALEIGKPKSEKEASDLDDNKIVLGLDDNQSNSVAPPVAAAPLDDIELNLEIDDSDGPLTTQNQDIPDIEIKDLGLELEQSDDPEPDKP
jgi:hypothetical protein